MILDLAIYLEVMGIILRVLELNCKVVNESIDGARIKTFILCCNFGYLGELI